MDCLIDQNSDLIDTVEEIERQACKRLRELEERVSKQKHSSQMELEERKSDMDNLIEFIRRARDDRKWDAEGMSFFHVKNVDLMGSREPIDR